MKKIFYLSALLISILQLNGSFSDYKVIHWANKAVTTALSPFPVAASSFWGLKWKINQLIDPTALQKSLNQLPLLDGLTQAFIDSLHLDPTIKYTLLENVPTLVADSLHNVIYIGILDGEQSLPTLLQECTQIQEAKNLLMQKQKSAPIDKQQQLQEIAKDLEEAEYDNQTRLNKYAAALQHEVTHIKHKDNQTRLAANVGLLIAAACALKKIWNISNNPYRPLIMAGSIVGINQLTILIYNLFIHYQEYRADRGVQQIELLKSLQETLQQWKEMRNMYIAQMDSELQKIPFIKRIFSLTYYRNLLLKCANLFPILEDHPSHQFRINRIQKQIDKLETEQSKVTMEIR